ncbi:MAG: class I SAM-dependent methyltransferase, partial [Chloroflexota bacterium]
CILCLLSLRCRLVVLRWLLEAIIPSNVDNLQKNKRLVRESYNAIAVDYLAARSELPAAAMADVRLLDEVVSRLAPGAWVLDAGCGAGEPVTRLLQERFRVVGVDFAETQLTLARRLTPNGAFVCQDLTALGFASACFDAVCSYYAIIHIPREEHKALFHGLRRLLKPGGLALLCLGAEDLAQDFEGDYFGRAMHWSHFDAETNLQLLQACGLDIVWTKFVPDGHEPSASHLFVLVQKPS